MSLKSVNITGRLIKATMSVNNGKIMATNLFLEVKGGKKYGNINFRVDCFGPIASKTARDLVKGDKITVEGTIKRPFMSGSEAMNHINADKIHYEWTKKYNEVYKPQQELFPMGEIA